jgi:cysteinyl-tRNA synthetase
VREIKLHDTRSGAVSPLEPRDPGRVGIYACGPTVYSRIHVGNARPFVVFSLMKRFLEHEGLDVTLVANVTDINDKIYTAARERGVPSHQLAREMTAAYLEDTDRLELGRPDVEPLATEMVGPIVGLIEDLVASGHAYEAGGDVYFRVRSLPTYGELSHRDVDQMDQGEGVEGSDRKEDPLDFALWKATKEDEDTQWESPWGPGRPGWHIECSAMAEQTLGVELDIHGGGIDLVFPHHENEAAQTQAARGRPLARLWVHNGMLELGGGGKMAKSVGNIVGLREALDEYGRDTLVMYFVSGHYRQPVAWGPDVLDQAARRVRGIREAARACAPGASPEDMGHLKEAFFAALADDFNTPKALASLSEWVSESNRRGGVGSDDLIEMLAVLGLENLAARDEGPPAELAELAERRLAAREAREFGEADRLRDEIAAAGWVVRDAPGGWELVRAG